MFLFIPLATSSDYLPGCRTLKFTIISVYRAYLLDLNEVEIAREQKQFKGKMLRNVFIYASKKSTLKNLFLRIKD
jgi:hypothetical protein